MIYKREDLRDGQKVWGCAYSTNNTEKSMALKKKPVFGIVKTTAPYKEEGFYELNKQGEPIKSSKVSLYARKYADTYEESVIMYNVSVQKQIDFLNGLIEDCESDKIV